MSWSPDQGALAQLAAVLAATLDARDRAKQKNAELSLRQTRSNPDIDNYLTFLLTRADAATGLSQQDATAARSAAGLLLKNHVRESWKVRSQENREYVKRHILLGLRDPIGPIRSYTGIVITEIVRQGGVLGWPSVLTELVTLVEDDSTANSAAIQDGAISALFKICEDNKKPLNKVYSGSRPLDSLVPKLIDFTNSANSKVRWQALAALDVFVDDNPPEAIQMNAEAILQSLTQRANDEHEEVRQYVCRLFTVMTANFPEMMVPHFGDVVQYILTQQRGDPGSKLALTAADFFYENGELSELRDSFERYLPQIIPVLLECMRYDEDEQARLEAEAEEDAEQEDREQDIKPQFATSKTDKGKPSQGQAPDGFAYEDDEEEGEIDEDDGEDDPEGAWTLRKCSAASLDTFASFFHGKVFDITLPYLKENLSHSEWPNREAAVLTLGAISTGCMDVVMPSLPDLVPYLLTLLNDPTTVVRIITCWTLGRYSSWAAQLDGTGKKEFFEPIMEGLLNRMQDKNKKVQKSAVAAFTSLEDGAKENLVPYGIAIAQQVVKCFDLYKDQNMVALYTCVSTLSEGLGLEMTEPAMVDTIMPALFKRWHLVDDASMEMFPLLECMAYLAPSMGTAFAPFAEPVYKRCIKVIRQNLEDAALMADLPAYEQPDKDFLVISLDLLSSVLQALGEEAAPLISSSKPTIFEVLSYCMRDSGHEVRQSAYALLGDCASNIPAEVQPYFEPLMKILILQLDVESIPKAQREVVYRVVNNACWSGGELAMRADSAIVGPFCDQLLERLGTILFKENIPASLHENAATAIGRLGLTLPDKLAPHLAQIAPRYLTVMQKVAWTEEKQHAMQGFTNVVRLNPQGLEQSLMLYLGEIATGLLQGVPAAKGFEEVLAQYRGVISDFSGYIGHLPGPQQQVLRQTYSIT